MNILNNKNKRISIFKALALCLFAAVSLTAVSCDDDMDIQQSYPFTVETMPVPNKVSKGQTVEIRCELKKTGDFANTLYTIRYFQFEGDGTLKMDNGITFLPNDRYLLENEKFRLYYTADGEEAHILHFLLIYRNGCIIVGCIVNMITVECIGAIAKIIKSIWLNNIMPVSKNTNIVIPKLKNSRKNTIPKRFTTCGIAKRLP